MAKKDFSSIREAVEFLSSHGYPDLEVIIKDYISRENKECSLQDIDGCGNVNCSCAKK